MTTNYASATAIGLCVTVALFWIMETLIRLHPVVVREPTVRGTLTFTRLVEDRPLATTDPRQRFDELKEPIEPAPRPQSNAGSIVSLAVRPPAAASRPLRTIDTLNTAVPDGPLVSMVRVRAVYPPRAAEIGLEGYVIVQFDVSETGRATNVTVVESSHRLFEKAAIDAARKFRFRPRMVDGHPQPSYGVRNLFRFEMERG